MLSAPRPIRPARIPTGRRTHPFSWVLRNYSGPQAILTAGIECLSNDSMRPPLMLASVMQVDCRDVGHGGRGTHFFQRGFPFFWGEP